MEFIAINDPVTGDTDISVIETNITSLKEVDPFVFSILSTGERGSLHSFISFASAAVVNNNMQQAQMNLKQRDLAQQQFFHHIVHEVQAFLLPLW